jgi:hypothetical protein
MHPRARLGVLCAGDGVSPLPLHPLQDYGIMWEAIEASGRAMVLTVEGASSPCCGASVGLGAVSVGVRGGGMSGVVVVAVCAGRMETGVGVNWQPRGDTLGFSAHHSVPSV